VYPVNGTSALASDVYENLVPIKDIIGDVFEKQLKEINPSGTLFYTDFTSSRVNRALHGRQNLPVCTKLEEMQGSIVWSVPVSRLINEFELFFEYISYYVFYRN